MKMNLVIMSGRLANEAEVISAGENTVAKFSLAVEGYKKDEVIFVDCECWGKRGESLAQYNKKGDQLLIRGTLKINKWTDDEDRTQRKHLINVDDWEFGQRKRED